MTTSSVSVASSEVLPEPTGATGTTEALDEAKRAFRRHQNLLLLASIGMLVASFMPWVETAFGTYQGFASAGRYTFYLAFIGIAGGLVPHRIPAGVQAALVAVGGIGLPAWQCAHLLSRVGVHGWVPGTGMLIIFASGILAARSAIGIFRPAT